MILIRSDRPFSSLFSSSLGTNLVFSINHEIQNRAKPLRDHRSQNVGRCSTTLQILSLLPFLSRSLCLHCYLCDDNFLAWIPDFSTSNMVFHPLAHRWHLYVFPINGAKRLLTRRNQLRSLDMPVESGRTNSLQIRPSDHMSPKPY